MDLRWANLDIGDFYGADLEGTNLEGVKALRTCFETANLMNAGFRNSSLYLANLEGTNFAKASFGQSGSGAED